MNTVELLQYSVDAAFNVLGMVTADLTQGMADWQPPGKASSIAANYSHLLKYSEYFLENIFIPSDDALLQMEPPAEVCMQDVQVEISVLHQYAGEVREAYKKWLSSLTPADLEVIFNTSIGPLNVGQMVELYIVWHINVHCGEISALKGCQGAKGYPW